MLEPDTWIIIEIEYKGIQMSKVLSGWYGGYLDGDSWRLSSNISKTTEYDDHYIVEHDSGTTYKLNKGCNKFSQLTGTIYCDLETKIKNDDGYIKCITWNEEQARVVKFGKRTGLRNQRLRS